MRILISCRQVFKRYAHLTIKSDLDRNNPNNVLNLTQQRIVSDLDSEVYQYRNPGLSQRARLNRFLAALLSNNFKASIAALKDIRAKSGNVHSKLSDNPIYLSCLISLATYYVRDIKKRIKLQELNEFTAFVIDLPKSHSDNNNSKDVEEVRGLTLIMYLRSLQPIEDGHRLNDINVTTQLKLLMRRFDYTSDKLHQFIIQSSVDALKEYQRVFPGNKNVIEKSGRKNTLSIDRYKNEDGSLSFDGLCKFIEQERLDSKVFTPKNNEKYYEIYDNLCQEDKDNFMHQYKSFNLQKQLVIESNCRNLYKFTSIPQQLSGFTNLHNSWIEKWHSDVAIEIKKLTESDPYNLKFGFLITHLGEHNIAALCLSYIMSSTIPAFNVKVLTLCNRLAYAFHVELSKLHAFSTQGSLKKLISMDHLKELAGDLLELTTSNCFMPKDILIGCNPDDLNAFRDRVFLHELVTAPNNSSFKRHGVIRIHPFISESFKNYSELLRAGSYQLPMLYPPRPWTSPKEGGFLSFQIPLVISKQLETYEYVMGMANKTGQLNSVYESLNTMASTPWAINPYMYKVFAHVLRKENLKDLLISSYRRSAQLENELKTELQLMITNPNVSHSKLKNKKRLLDQNKTDRINLDHYYGFVDKFARSLSLQGEVFYLPHSLDFRGRVYPSVSFLSHHSEDSIRSLMMFWEAKELGEQGFDWLIYQLANLYSKTKLDMAELKNFVKINKAHIIESSKEPFAGDMWWTKGDSPWQVLALCKEINAVWEFTGDIAKFKSRIPIHQDGTCNGLQHYSALSGDVLAAEAVNVLPTERRQDIYSTILKLVQDQIEKESLQPENKASELAREVLPILKRKLIKQTVMTTVYGVTLYGATRQIKDQIDDYILQNPFAENSQYLRNNSFPIASYVASHVLLSINKLFSGAKLIQEWLVSNCLRSIQSFSAADINEDFDFFSRKHYQPFMWTSLSGFPVVQYYRKVKRGIIKSKLQSMQLRQVNNVALIDVQKLVNGVAPNFIHSIDALHLTMTSVACKNSGITFAAIHDCFWTHASNTAILSSILREQFIRLHKSNVMENMRHDVAHINRNKYQLVWVEISSNQQFCDRLQLKRSTYSIEPRKRGGNYNAILKQEILMPNLVEDIISEFNPELLYCDKASNDPIIYNISAGIVRKRVKIAHDTHVPLLVPVRVLELPNVGKLHIDLVQKSVFFFS